MFFQRSLARRLGRRSFLAGLSITASGLLAACAGSPSTSPTVSPVSANSPPTAPAVAPTKAPAAVSAPSTGTLKGTKLSILAGQWFVPATNTMFDDMVKKLNADTGMQAKVERLGEQQVPKIQAIVETGTGGDVTILTDTDPYLYGAKLYDVSPLANDIDKAWHGWYDIAKQSCIVDGKWRALMIGQAPAAWNWRPDLFKAAGLDKFPDTFDGLLEASKALKEKGTPVGMTLGHAAGDARSTNYPVLWAFGGKEFDKDGTTVAINSPETIKSIEWYVNLFKNEDPAVLSWLDPDNNQAFLAGKVAATVNVNTIYLAARDSKDANQKHVAEVMDHANWPSGPAGQFANYNINHWSGFDSSKNKPGIDAFMQAFFDKKFLVPWTKTGQSYFIPTLKDIETEDAWPDDPKLKVFRELNKINRLIGWEGPPTRAVAEGVAKFVVDDMYAQAVTGKMKPADAAKWAADQYKSFVAKTK